MGQDNNGTDFLQENGLHCSTEKETIFVLHSLS